MITYSLDFIEIKSKSNGACSIFSCKENGQTTLSLTDCGYKSTFDDVKKYINRVYGDDTYFDNVIVTHNDQDHTGGICDFLETYKVGKIWMFRPWKHASILKKIHWYYKKEQIHCIEKRFKESYSNLFEIEKVANALSIPIEEPLQGTKIGRSLVVSPSLKFFIQNVINADMAQQEKEGSQDSSLLTESSVASQQRRVYWGDEHFPEEDATTGNQMSVVQYIDAGEKILLTGDVGREGLTKAIKYLRDRNYGEMPEINYFEVPHHGSRHNLNSDLLDELFGHKINPYYKKFIAIVQASSLDETHPRKTVTRALMHRGGVVYKVDDVSFTISTSPNRKKSFYEPDPLEYPESED